MRDRFCIFRPVLTVLRVVAGTITPNLILAVGKMGAVAVITATSKAVVTAAIIPVIGVVVAVTTAIIPVMAGVVAVITAINKVMDTAATTTAISKVPGMITPAITTTATIQITNAIATPVAIITTATKIS